MSRTGAMDKKLRRLCVRLYEDDVVAAEKLVTPDISFNLLLREAFHTFIQQAEARLRQRIDEMERNDNDRNTHRTQHEPTS